ASPDAVRAVGVTETARVDVGVEDREVRRMKHAVAEAHDCGERKQPVDARNEAGDERATGEQTDAAEQDRARAEAVHGKARPELAYAARHVEHADGRAQRRVAHGELR